MIPTRSAGNLQGCFLSDSIPQHPESASQSPLVPGMVVNWLFRLCFSQTTSFLFIQQPSGPFAAIQLNQPNIELCRLFVLLGHLRHLQSKAVGTEVSHCHKGYGSCPGSFRSQISFKSYIKQGSLHYLNKVSNAPTRVFKWVFKSSSYFHSFCAAPARLAQPAPLFPGTRGCPALAGSEVNRRTPAIILVMNHTFLRTSLAGKYRLCRPVSKAGATNTSKPKSWWYFFWKALNHSTQRCWCTSCSCGAALWELHGSLTMDLSPAAGISCRCSPDEFLASELLWEIIHF